MKKTFSILLAVILLFTSFAFTSIAEEAEDEEQYYFFTDSLLVLINRENSVYGKTYSPEFFDGDYVAKVTDLTYYGEEYADDLASDPDFRQILMLTLYQPSESVVDFLIESISGYPTVESAEYNLVEYWTPLGDVDGDNDVTSADARQILRFSVGLDDPTEEQEFFGDMDDDFMLTASDARLALRTAVGLETVYLFFNP